MTHKTVHEIRSVIFLPLKFADDVLPFFSSSSSLCSSSHALVIILSSPSSIGSSCSSPSSEPCSSLIISTSLSLVERFAFFFGASSSSSVFVSSSERFLLVVALFADRRRRDSGWLDDSTIVTAGSGRLRRASRLARLRGWHAPHEGVGRRSRRTRAAPTEAAASRVYMYTSQLLRRLIIRGAGVRDRGAPSDAARPCAPTHGMTLGDAMCGLFDRRPANRESARGRERLTQSPTSRDRFSPVSCVQGLPRWRDD